MAGFAVVWGDECDASPTSHVSDCCVRPMSAASMLFFTSTFSVTASTMNGTRSDTSWIQ